MSPRQLAVMQKVFEKFKHSEGHWLTGPNNAGIKGLNIKVDTTSNDIIEVDKKMEALQNAFGIEEVVGGIIRFIRWARFTIGNDLRET